MAFARHKTNEHTRDFLHLHTNGNTPFYSRSSGAEHARFTPPKNFEATVRAHHFSQSIQSELNQRYGTHLQEGAAEIALEGSDERPPVRVQVARSDGRHLPLIGAAQQASHAIVASTRSVHRLEQRERYVRLPSPPDPKYQCDRGKSRGAGARETREGEGGGREQRRSRLTRPRCRVDHTVGRKLGGKPHACSLAL